MNPFKRPVVAALLASTVALSPAFAKGSPDSKGKGKDQSEHPSKGKGKDKGQAPPQGPGKQEKPGKKQDKALEKELKRAGIGGAEAKRLAKSHGFGGFKPLPPGIRKNLMRGKPLPPGLAYHRLPDAYLGALPRHDGYEWRAYGSDLVLVSPTTLLIADILADALD